MSPGETLFIDKNVCCFYISSGKYVVGIVRMHMVDAVLTILYNSVVYYSVLIVNFTHAFQTDISLCTSYAIFCMD